MSRVKCGLPHAIPDGWEVLDGDGEGLLDPKDQATLRANLNCVAGENVSDPKSKRNPVSSVTRGKSKNANNNGEWESFKTLSVDHGSVIVVATSDGPTSLRLVSDDDSPVSRTKAIPLTHDAVMKQYVLNETFSVPPNTVVRIRPDPALMGQWMDYALWNAELS